jgi:hypothetical protein
VPDEPALSIEIPVVAVLVGWSVGLTIAINPELPVWAIELFFA